MTHRSVSIGVVLLAAACSEGKDDKTADDVEPCVKSSARTAGTAAKTGGATAIEGVQTLGDSIGGLFEGGKEEAKRRWQQGKLKTRQTAESGGAETKATAAQDECKK